jgi:hypothetical protein
VRPTCLMLVAVCAWTVGAVADDGKPVQAGPKDAPADNSIETAARAQGGDRAALRARILKEVRKLADQQIDKSRSPQDKLTGFVTFSVPANASTDYPYAAYVYLKWGDLDKVIKKGGKEYYSNWDGHVKVQESARASIVQEFAFEDKGRRQPGPGSGRDDLVKDGNPAQVDWKSGVVGATDGLLVILSLQKPEASGEIAAGPFTIPYTVSPRPPAVGARQ